MHYGRKHSYAARAAAMLPGLQLQPASISLELALPAVRDGLIVIIASTYGTGPAIQRKVAIVVDIPASKHRTAHLPGT